MTTAPTEAESFQSFSLCAAPAAPTLSHIKMHKRASVPLCPAVIIVHVFQCRTRAVRAHLPNLDFFPQFFFFVLLMVVPAIKSITVSFFFFFSFDFSEIKRFARKKTDQPAPSFV
jgi:hypothetical protein